jgi:hypothetical protein
MLMATAGSVITKSSHAGQWRRRPIVSRAYSVTPSRAFGTPSSRERGLRKRTAQPPSSIWQTSGPVSQDGSTR